MIWGILPGGLALAALTFAPTDRVGAASANPLPVAVQAAGIRLAVAPTGNTARYRVREQLVGRDLPNDAVGETSEVSGAITISADGRVVPAQSRIVVNTSNFTSDSERRDGYVRRRLLEAEQFPSVELVPTAFRGVSGTLPRSGTRTFDLVGNLTIRGVTRPTVWRVQAQFQGNRVTGTAATKFAFSDFGLTQPRVPIVLSVADTIRLEYDFNLSAGPQPR
jgi:polyisoprenoid-binding protein YceI